MKIYRGFIIAALLTALAVSASAVTILVPENTVIPVTLDKTLSSATNRVGDTFVAHHEGVNGAGFPDGTKFTGRVESVTRASGKAAGQIGVAFVSAKLPNGTYVPIEGKLTSLDEKSVQTDPATGRLVGTTSAQKANLKFIAYGAGGGLLIGELTGKNKALYTILGAAAGYFYGQKQAKPAVGKDVQVLAGTGFGILLGQDVALADSTPTAVAGVTAFVPSSGPGWQVSFLQPFMSGNDLMVPFRSVMDSIDMPYEYDSTARTIRVSSGDSEAVHNVGTKLIYFNGKAIELDAASRIVHDAVYVPVSYIELLTGRTAYWNQKSGVLRIE